MIPVRVSRLAMDGTAGTNLVVLQELNGTRMLPIWIGRAEAEAIARHLEGVPNERPLTHDLARALVASLGGLIKRVMVTHVSENTFFAQLVVEHNGTDFLIDARPSDAIALALRADAPMFAAEALLAHYPSLDDDENAEDGAQSGEEPDMPEIPGFTSAEQDELSSGDDVEHDDGGYQSPSATGKPASSDLQRYLEQLRPEDFGKFRP
ncbi:MAG: bifunctional nuclease family protein [Gemmatimonadetes bacterium]|nr:bifunctional nuclease family protein [Gemmatimonadota bacterium]